MFLKLNQYSGAACKKAENFVYFEIFLQHYFFLFYYFPIFDFAV